jgi:fumarate reductase subunit D
MKPAIAWIAKMMSEGDGSPSTKRILFVVSVLACLVFCAVHVVMHGLESNTIDLAKGVLFTTGGAYTAGRFAEATEKQ